MYEVVIHGDFTDIEITFAEHFFPNIRGKVDIVECFCQSILGRQLTNEETHINTYTKRTSLSIRFCHTFGSLFKI